MNKDQALSCLLIDYYKCREKLNNIRDAADRAYELEKNKIGPTLECLIEICNELDVTLEGD